MQANPMRSLYGFAKQREEEANGLTQILGQVLGQNADLSGNQQQQQQPVVQDALFRTPPGFDQTPFKAQNMPYLTSPGSDQTPFVPQLLQANAPALSDAQKNGWISSQTDASVAQRLGVAQPEAVDAATAPLMAPRAAAPENAKATIESILAGLGDNPEDAAKKAKNMSQGEMWLALGKGIGQIGKGQAVDISSVVQMRQQRLATSAAETKDVARRRAAASLVFEQSGDASMATAVGQGAISYSDFTTERQRKEVNARANAALVKEAQKNGIMAEIVGGMDFLSDEQKELYAKATKEGVDLTTLMKPYELEQAANKAALETAKLDEIEQQRAGAQKFYKESSVPVDQATARYLEQTDMSVKEARELALKDFPSTGGDTGISAQDAAANRASAQVIIDNPDATTIAKAAAEQVITLDGYADTKAMLEAVSKSQPPVAPVDTTAVTPAMRQANLLAAKVTLGSETSTPQARAVAQAVLDADGGVSMDDALKTVQAGQTPAAPVDTTVVTPAMREANLAAAKVTLGSETSTLEARAVAQAVVAADGGVSMADTLTAVKAGQPPASADARTTDEKNWAADTADRQTRNEPPLTFAAYQAIQNSGKVLGDPLANELYKNGLEPVYDDQGVMQRDPETNQPITREIPGGSAQVARLNREAKEAAAAGDQAVSDAKATKSQMLIQQSADVVLLNGKQLLDASKNFGSSIGAATIRAAQSLIWGSDMYSIGLNADAVTNNIALTTMQQRRDASPTGGFLGNVSDKDVTLVKGTFGPLDLKGDPALLRQNAKMAMNAYFDAIYGTKAQLEQFVTEGKITAAVADQLSSRYDVADDKNYDPTPTLSLSPATSTITNDDATTLSPGVYIVDENGNLELVEE